MGRNKKKHKFNEKVAQIGKEQEGMCECTGMWKITFFIYEMGNILE